VNFYGLLLKKSIILGDAKIWMDVTSCFFQMHVKPKNQKGGLNRGVDTGLESCLKIYKDLKISENLSKIHELF
jgi:hypothetical protein